MNSKQNIFFLLILLLPFFAQAQIIINVDDAPYNAVGDGVTDDSLAIQKALNDLESNGGTLQFTSGKTYIAAGLTLYHFPANKTYTIKSSGTTPALIKVPDGMANGWGSWIFRICDSKNLTIQNLNFDGNRATRNPDHEVSGSSLLQIEQNCNGLRLNNLHLANSVMDNVYIEAYDPNHQGGPVPFMSDFEMHHCVLEDAFRNNMSVISGENFKIISCEFIHAHGQLPEAGIDFEPDPGKHGYTNMTVEGCLFKDNNRYGIELTNPLPLTGNSTIKNNVFDGNGILVGSKDNEINNNIFVNKVGGTYFNDNSIRDGIIHFHAAFTNTNNNVHHNYFYDNDLTSLIYFMSNAGGGNNVHDNYENGNTISSFVTNNTNPDTNPGQTVTNNTSLNRREMGYWNMDAAQINNSTITDLSDFNHDGTITGATSVAGVENEALDFAPDDRYITVPANDNLNIAMNFTVMAWIKWNGVNADEAQQVIVGRGNDWRFRVSNTGQVGFYSAPVSANFTQSPANAIPTNVWKLVTATYNGRDTKIYIDGSEVASNQTEGSLGADLSNLYIGAFQTNTYSFNGAIDDVRIYNYSLSQAEIQDIFAASPLSVEWLYPLTARKQNNQVILHWTVAQQINNEKFIVEHSTDGIHFDAIQTIHADGDLVLSKEFKALHTTPNKGDNYYRIKQIDYDGQFDYSNIAFVRFEPRDISIYPNPATQEIHLDTQKEISRQIEIFNTTGQLVKQLSQKSNTIPIGDLPKGIYWMRISEEQQNFLKRFVRE